MDEILLRSLTAAAIAGGGIAAYAAVNRFLLWRARHRAQGLEGLRRGTPAVLYFSDPACRPCHSVQRPTLEALQRLLSHRLQVIEVDASARPDLANFWGVLSVPTTFVIDRQGHPRRVNHGLASREKLLRQLGEVDGDGVGV